MTYDEKSAAQALSALGHEVRLQVFRLLVRAGDKGLSVGEIGTHLGVPPSTLAHHLSALVQAGLVVQERQGRIVFNHVDYARMRALLTYVSSQCCAGIVPLIDDEVA
ncbi:MAG: metalloregulator ArsR/SmtB family transcription factor [Alphaproteobacteria bacterium]|nr:metalloregulator ArsR/SmtB family transcription factor [Alphaproteobacteria bacterium]